VKQTPLPKAKAGAADRITIANADLTSESVALAGVREQARFLASEGDNDQVAPPHPIMDRTLAELRRQSHPILASLLLMVPGSSSAR
jgi:hypothetical protein